MYCTVLYGTVRTDDLRLCLPEPNECNVGLRAVAAAAVFTEHCMTAGTTHCITAQYVL